MGSRLPAHELRSHRRVREDVRRSRRGQEDLQTRDARHPGRGRRGRQERARRLEEVWHEGYWWRAKGGERRGKERDSRRGGRAEPRQVEFAEQNDADGERGRRKWRPK